MFVAWRKVLKSHFFLFAFISFDFFFSYMSNLLLVLCSVHAFHRVFFLAGWTIIDGSMSATVCWFFLYLWRAIRFVIFSEGFLSGVFKFFSIHTLATLSLVVPNEIQWLLYCLSCFFYAKAIFLVKWDEGDYNFSAVFFEQYRKKNFLFFFYFGTPFLPNLFVISSLVMISPFRTIRYDEENCEWSCVL